MRIAIVTTENNECYDLQLKKIKDYLPTDALSIQDKFLTLNFIEENKIDILVASCLSKDWCYLLRGLGIVTIVFGQFDFYSQIVDVVIDYKNSGRNHYFTGSNFDFNHVSPESFVEIAGIVKKLDWDSNFFGFNVAYVSCLHLSENILKIISNYVIDNNVRLIEYLCNCHDRKSVLIAEREGFSFVDIRLTFLMQLKKFKLSGYLGGFKFRKCADDDINELQRIAGPIYTSSRFFFDDRFGVSKAQEYYENWVRKAVRGEFDDECWCLTTDENIVAFCTLRFSGDKHAQIGLVGVHERFVGRGIGKEMLQNILCMLMDKSFSEIEVVTQGRNYSAQNLYQSLGFKTKQTQLWYHKWR